MPDGRHEELGHPNPYIFQMMAHQGIWTLEKHHSISPRFCNMQEAVRNILTWRKGSWVWKRISNVRVLSLWSVSLFWLQSFHVPYTHHKVTHPLEPWPTEEGIFSPGAPLWKPPLWGLWDGRAVLLPETFSGVTNLGTELYWRSSFFLSPANVSICVSKTGGYTVVAQPPSSISIAPTEISLRRKNYATKWMPGWCASIKEFWEVLQVWVFFLLLFYNQRKRHLHFPSEKLEFSSKWFCEVLMESSILVAIAPKIGLVNSKSFLFICLIHYTVQRVIKDCKLWYPSTSLNNQHKKNTF